MMDFCFPHSYFLNAFSCLSTLFFFTLMAPIILLPSTRMRHHFFCFWELQISSELALEEMGGDRSGSRWGDGLASMFELALTQGGRESMLGNQRDFRGQIAAFQSHEWRFILGATCCSSSLPKWLGSDEGGCSQGDIYMRATQPPLLARSAEWGIMSNEPNRWDIKVPMLMNSQMLILIAK